MQTSWKTLFLGDLHFTFTPNMPSCHHVVMRMAYWTHVSVCSTSTVSVCSCTIVHGVCQIHSYSFQFEINYSWPIHLWFYVFESSIIPRPHAYSVWYYQNIFCFLLVHTGIHPLTIGYHFPCCTAWFHFFVVLCSTQHTQRYNQNHEWIYDLMWHILA